MIGPFTEMDHVISIRFPEVRWKHSAHLVRAPGGLWAIVYSEPNRPLVCSCDAGQKRERTRFEDDPSEACEHETEVVQFLNPPESPSRFAPSEPSRVINYCD